MENHPPTLVQPLPSPWIIRYAVRRLTPRECERLQGLDDDHTATGDQGPLADGPRYKMIGNGWAKNVFVWLGERITAAETARIEFSPVPA